MNLLKNKLLLCFFSTSVILLGSIIAAGQKPNDPTDPFIVTTPNKDSKSTPKNKLIEKLTKKSLPSLVSITHSGREGKIRGTGTGFLISPDGLIATNYHVIGDGRPIQVELYDGSTYEATTVHAWDRRADLAIIKIDPKKKLTALDIGNSDGIKQGQSIVAFGNPRGLQFSVVTGLISAIRKLEDDFAIEGGTPDFPMIQIAIPIEMGNSGGPIIDLDGKVVGIVTIKSLVTPNLGFATPVNILKSMIDNPNPVPMHRWLTIGNLDPNQWNPIMGGEWKQHAGIITVDAYGNGFGGRTLCLSELTVPKEPYEVEVKVKLDDESGAAGLAFASDGNEVHYGFYPSNGQLRLTRFEGPDIYSWKILKQIKTDAYLPGQWNKIRARITENKITCFVNGEVIMEIEDDALRGGKVGLCRFRKPTAHFKAFRIGVDLSEKPLAKELMNELSKQIDTYSRNGGDQQKVAARLASHVMPSKRLLNRKADELEAQAHRLRHLTKMLHETDIQQQLLKILSQDEAKINLLEAGLLIAKLDNLDLDIDGYLQEFNRLATAARQTLSEEYSELEKVQRLGKFLFQENGFHGSRGEYYHKSNSYLNEVLDDREGIPITLSVIYIELARLLDIPHVYGIPLPGHFVVAYRPSENELHLFDTFQAGKAISKLEAAALVQNTTGQGLDERSLTPSPKRDIILRMLNNLINLEINKKDSSKALPYLNLLLNIDPKRAPERFERSRIRFQTDDHDGAIEDLQWLIDNKPSGMNLDLIQQLLDRLH